MTAFSFRLPVIRLSRSKSSIAFTKSPYFLIRYIPSRKRE